ncbi:MAG: glutamyl-tRNA reductase [Phycisphaerales bacterium]|nr:glutamyl-tRNA reductase [Phycisphaerales bacterium]
MFISDVVNRKYQTEIASNTLVAYLPEYIVSTFCVVGVNYRKANTNDRSLFSLSEDTCADIQQYFQAHGIKDILILSTCCRTEIYSYTHSPETLINLLISYTKGSSELFTTIGFTKKGAPALHYLFEVVAGLQSQILGDYEILGQFKKAYLLAQKCNTLGAVFQRTCSLVLQAAKEVRTKTKISSGTVSVSYAAIEWLKNKNIKPTDPILLVGTGKFGKSVIKNIQHYFGTSNITIANRNIDKAQSLAASLNLSYIPYAQIEEVAQTSTVIIVCTHAPHYTIVPTFFKNTSTPKIILDLSIPLNVDPAIKKNKNIEIANVDEVSVILNQTIDKRKLEIPEAKKIITHYYQEFIDWLNHFKHTRHIDTIKQKLEDIKHWQMQVASPPSTTIKNVPSKEDYEHVEQTVNYLVVNLRKKKSKGCQYLSTLNQFVTS